MSKLQALWPPTQSKGGTRARKMAGQCDEILATCKEIQSTLRDSSSIHAPRVQEVLGATAALQLFGAAAQHTRCQATPVLLTAGVLHESSVHECLKSSLAFRKPATAVASRRPGRADGLMVGLDGHASLSAGRAPWRDGQAFLPLRRRPEGKVCRRRRQNDAVRPSV